MQVKEAGRPLNVVIVGSWIKGLQYDVFLGAHGAYFGMLGKLERIKAGAGENVWIDPSGYQAAVAEREQAFETELKRQGN